MTWTDQRPTAGKCCELCQPERREVMDDKIKRARQRAEGIKLRVESAKTNRSLVDLLGHEAEGCADLLVALADELEAARKENARLKAEHADCDNIMTQRDHWEGQVGDMAAQAGCTDEFSCCHDHRDCVAEQMAVLKARYDAERARAEKAEREMDEALHRLESRDEECDHLEVIEDRNAKQLSALRTERDSLRARLADLERWREQAGPAIGRLTVERDEALVKLKESEEFHAGAPSLTVYGHLCDGIQLYREVAIASAHGRKRSLDSALAATSDWERDHGQLMGVDVTS